MRPEAQFAVHQWAQFSADTKIPHYQAIKRVLKYPKGTDMEGLIIKPYPEKGIEWYIDNDFSRRWNQ